MSDDPLTVREWVRWIPLRLRMTYRWWFGCRHFWTTPTTRNTWRLHMCHRGRWHGGNHRE